MSGHLPRLTAPVLIGTIAALGLLALAAASPVGRHARPPVGPVVALAPDDAQAIIRRRTITPEFDTRASLRVEGRDVSLGGPLSCDSGEGWRIDVTVTQGQSSETARTAGNCTGTVQEWRGRVAGDRLRTFRPGSARACARLVTTAATDGDVTDRHRWCRDVTLVSESAPAVAAAADEDEDDDGDTLSVVALIVAGLALLFGAVTLVLARRRT